MIREKSKKEIGILREAGKKLAEVMDKLEKRITPGVSGKELDKLARKLVFNRGGKPSFLNFSNGASRPFPSAICFSVNNEVVHGVPGNKILKVGDLLKIDIGMDYKGLFVDMARTFAVGKISKQAEKLLETTKKCLDMGIREVREGAKMSEYSKTVQKRAEENGFSVIRNLVGHGVGYAVHEDPQIPNYYSQNYKDVMLKSGMILALEPMVNEGGYEIMLDKDGWTFKTKDGKLSAHFEDTVVVTEKGVEVLTRL